MKNVIITSAVLCMMGSASLACTTAQSSALSGSISTLVQQVVAADVENLEKSMSIMTLAAVAEYHSDAVSSTCDRQIQILDKLTEISNSLHSEKSAMLRENAL